MNRATAATRPSPQRSVATNDPRRLVGVDGNTAKARRYRDLVEQLTAEVGGELTASEVLQVRTAAGLQLHAEELTAALVRGEAVDPEEFSRAANGATRAIIGLKRRRSTKAPVPAGRSALDAHMRARREAVA